MNCQSDHVSLQEGNSPFERCGVALTTLLRVIIVTVRGLEYQDKLRGFDLSEAKKGGRQRGCVIGLRLPGIGPVGATVGDITGRDHGAKQRPHALSAPWLRYRACW